MHRDDRPCDPPLGPSSSSSPVFRRRRSLKSPSVTPGTSGRSTPSNVRLSGDFESPGGPTPGKQKRLSAELNFVGLDIKLETIDVGGSDIEEEVVLDPPGASQYGDMDDVDPEAGGLLLGFAYFPAEVTLPNKVPARAEFVELELTPGKSLFLHK